MATTKDVERLPSGRIKYRGETFAGFNKPKRTPGKAKKSAVLAKKALKLNWFGSGTLRCLSRKTSREDVKTFVHDTIVTRQKTNFRPDTGPVRRGDMKVEEVLKLLEKHEAECNERYQKIDKQLDKLDMRLWGIALLIIATAIAGKLL